MKKLSKFLALLMLLTAGFSVMIACDGLKGDFTYNSYFSTFPTNWNPHEYSYTDEGTILGYLSESFVSAMLKDEGNGRYSAEGWEWKPVLATKLPEDVTATYAGTGHPYGIPAGADSGYAFKITLRDDIKWQNGDPINAHDYVESFQFLMDPARVNYRTSGYLNKTNSTRPANIIEYYNAIKDGGTYDWDANVGYKALSDHELLIVYSAFNAQFYAYNGFPDSTILVHKETYMATEQLMGDALKTTYGTRPGTTMSYGPYTLTRLQPDAQMILEKNPTWVGNKIKAFDNLYQTTKIVYNKIVESSVAMLAFQKGEIDGVGLTATDYPIYQDSSRLRVAPTNQTWSLYINGDKDLLKTIESASSGKMANVQALSSNKFRRALSYALDRKELVKNHTAGSLPEVVYLNGQWVHDFINNPNLAFRYTRPGMEYMAQLFNVEGYATMDDATLKEEILKIDGYDVDLARQLFTEAWTELAADGVTINGDVKIDFQVPASSFSATLQARVDFIKDCIEIASTDSGHKVIITPVADPNCYDNMDQGTIPLGLLSAGYGYIYPDRQIVGMMNPDILKYEKGVEYTDIELTITIGGTALTKKAGEWGEALMEEYASADQEVKALIIGAIEKMIVEQGFVIPLYSTVSYSLQTLKYNSGLEVYDQLFGYGGFAYLQYQYNDTQWAEYLTEWEGGIIDYAAI